MRFETCKEVVYKRASGFTLAEVLVTLAIIGVVAALTIPGLINSTNKSQYESALKKNYSVISQAYKSLQTDGDMENFFPGTDSGAAALNLLAPKLNLLKNCSPGSGCWYNTPVKLLDSTNSFYSNMDSHATSSTYGNAILADGSIIHIVDLGTHCTTSAGPFVYGPLLNSTCGILYLDVNGVKGPNMVGRDYFAFYITKTGIYPYGTYGDISDCKPANPSSDGFGCAATVLEQGMNY